MKLKKLFAAFAIAILTLTFSSCSKSSSPVQQFANALNSMTAKIDKADNIEDFNAVGKDLENADQIIKDNAGYVLTVEDKTTLTAAIIALSKASYYKGAKFNGMEVSELHTSFMEQNIRNLVARAKTLGNLNDNSLIADEAIETAETVEPATEANDSIY